MNTVFVIEHRQIDIQSGSVENVLAHISSTKEKAIEWCKNNLNYEEKHKTHPWWFYVSEENVDSDLVSDFPDFTIMGWNGEELSAQPWDGYDGLKYKDV